MTHLKKMRDRPLRTQLMLVFGLLCITTTTISTITLTTLAVRRMHAGLRDKSVQYARQLQQQLQSVVAFDDRLTARELFVSLMGDPDVDGPPFRPRSRRVRVTSLPLQGSRPAKGAMGACT
jgi:hypothetical protein